MELLQQAINFNEFGLRKQFPWSIRHYGDIKINIEYNNIKFTEKLYLSQLLNNQLDIEDASISRIENPYLWSRYVLQYEEMKANSVSRNVKELIVIHATSISAAFEIAVDNFDWRLVHRHRFGHGVSFAKDVDYAAKQSTKKGAYIVAGVLIGNSNVGKYNTLIPPGFSDTTTNAAKSVFVKYYDNDFYPYYIVY